jgi:hypothetical protein
MWLDCREEDHVVAPGAYSSPNDLQNLASQDTHNERIQIVDENKKFT